MKTFKKLTIVKTAFALALATLTLSSCLKNNSDDFKPTPVSAIAFYHASPGTPDFDFVIEGNQALGPFKFGYKTAYYQSTTGQTPFALYKAGKTTVADTIKTGKFNLEAGKYYSFFVIGEGPVPNFLLVKDSIVTPSTGKARVRFINLIPDASPLTLSTGTDSTLFSSVAYKSASEFSEIPATKTYTFKVGNGSTTTATIPDVQITSGNIYTIWANGKISSTIDSLKPTIKVTNLFPSNN